jgi:predicted transposase YbfD/YdcC
MKFTQYFMHTRTRPDRQSIKLEWIQQAVDNPDAEHVQRDGRIRRWKRIDDAAGRFLRVVLLEDGETVHNAFFDRRFRR